MASIADRMFEGRDAESELARSLCRSGAGDFVDMGYDDYDLSLELRCAGDGLRLSEESQRIIHEAGFAKVYVNHKNKWETHYNFHAAKFVPSDGWRVSYPHKRGAEENGIWVEAIVPTWPKEWFDTGYAIVKPPSTSPTP